MFEGIRTHVRWWRTWGTLPVGPWVKAASHYRSGEFSGAEKHYLDGISRFPNHPARFSARLDLAYCFFKNAKIDEAKDQLTYVTVHAPEIREAHVRLTKLQLWLGHSCEAAWTIRGALEKIVPDGEMVGLFLLAAVENIGSSYLVQEAIAAVSKLTSQEKQHALVQLGLVKHSILTGGIDRAKAKLPALLTSDSPPVEALTLHAELLLEEEKLLESRYQLRRALVLRPDCPQVLSLLAKTYLVEGEWYNPDFAMQLASKACQGTVWKSPRDLHVLANTYLHLGDKISALLVASKAKEVGASLLGAYRDEKNLDRLIEDLSTGTQQ